MKQSFTILCAMLPILLNAQSDWTGYWKGVLKVQGLEIDMYFDIAQGDTAWTCAMDVPLQGLEALPASPVTIDAGNLTAVFPMIPGSYEGQLAEDGSGVRGHWIQGGQQFVLDLVRVDKTQVQSRPQEPIPPFPYESVDVTFQCATDDSVELAGTFTYPADAESANAVILVSGSGPQDRNEEIMGHKPFLLLSDYLTRNGIAVLRYDDRGFGESSGSRATSTVADFAEDAKGALAYLRQQEFIACNKVGVIGHSEGGMVAAILGAEQVVDFAVMMAGPGTLLDDLLVDQIQFMNKHAGYSDEVIAQDTAYARSLYGLVKEAGDGEMDTTRLRVLVEEYYEGSAAIQSQFPDMGSFYTSQVTQVSSPWFRHFLNFVPQDYIRKMSCPVLALNGSLDFQVPPKNLSAIQEALIEGPCVDFEIRNFPGLNHLFQPAQSGHLDEYARINITIDPAVLETIATWVRKRS